MLRASRILSRRVYSSLPSLNTLTSEEMMLKEVVGKFARDQLAPKVAMMDEKELLDPSILKGLFDQGILICSWRAHY
jgi:hypothetical protein